MPWRFEATDADDGWKTIAGFLVPLSQPLTVVFGTGSEKRYALIFAPQRGVSLACPATKLRAFTVLARAGRGFVARSHRDATADLSSLHASSGD